MAAALKTIYRAPTQAAAEAALNAFEAGPWGHKYSAIARSWRSAWEQVTPFFAFSQPIRRAILSGVPDAHERGIGVIGDDGPRVGSGARRAPGTDALVVRPGSVGRHRRREGECEGNS